MIPHIPVPLLMYHKVEGSIAYSNSWIMPETFRRQMETLAEYGYQSISFDDFQAGRQGKRLPEKPFILTFDDGYQSVYTEAFPVLKELGFTATLFLVPSFHIGEIRQDNAWDNTGENKWKTYHLLWPEIIEMVRHGFSIGAHGMTHRPLIYLSYGTVESETRRSKSILEKRLSMPVKVFSYPLSAGSDVLIIRQIVQSAGYTMAVASGGNPTEYLDTRGLFALRRKTMIEELSFPDQFLTYIDPSWSKNEI